MSARVEHNRTQEHQPKACTYGNVMLGITGALLIAGAALAQRLTEGEGWGSGVTICYGVGGAAVLGAGCACCWRRRAMTVAARSVPAPRAGQPVPAARLALSLNKLSVDRRMQVEETLRELQTPWSEKDVARHQLKGKLEVPEPFYTDISRRNLREAAFEGIEPLTLPKGWGSQDERASLVTRKLQDWFAHHQRWDAEGVDWVFGIETAMSQRCDQALAAVTLQLQAAMDGTKTPGFFRARHQEWAFAILSTKAAGNVVEIRVTHVGEMRDEDDKAVSAEIRPQLTVQLSCVEGQWAFEQPKLELLDQERQVLWALQPHVLDHVVHRQLLRSLKALQHDTHAQAALAAVTGRPLALAPEKGQKWPLSFSEDVARNPGVLIVGKERLTFERGHPSLKLIDDFLRTQLGKKHYDWIAPLEVCMSQVFTGLTGLMVRQFQLALNRDAGATPQGTWMPVPETCEYQITPCNKGEGYDIRFSQRGYMHQGKGGVPLTPELQLIVTGKLVRRQKEYYITEPNLGFIRSRAPVVRAHSSFRLY